MSHIVIGELVEKIGGDIIIATMVVETIEVRTIRDESDEDTSGVDFKDLDPSFLALFFTLIVGSSVGLLPNNFKKY